MPLKISEISKADYEYQSPYSRITAALREYADEAAMDSYTTCLSLVHEHIKDLRQEYVGKNEKVVEALDRLYNRIAEDTK